MSPPYSGNKCCEEEELDMLYFEIEERIMLLISSEEEENQVKKTERVPLLPMNKNTTQAPPNNSSFLDISWYNNSIKELQSTKQRRCYYGRENIGKKKNKQLIQYGERNIGGRRLSEISRSRGTGVFIPKSASFSSATLVYHN